jgi:hypothetical protein
MLPVTMIPEVNGSPWYVREDDGARYRIVTIPKPDLNMCPGFACSLPEVDEVVMAYPQWKERTLTEWLGEPPTAPLLLCLAALEGGKNQAEADRVEKQRQESEAKNGR